MAQSLLVVGGGFSGITTALEAAEVGYEVYIVEKNPFLGGRVAQLNQYFPKLCPPSCGLEIQFQRIKKNPLVHFFTLSELVSVSGGKGNYTVKIKSQPRYVNSNCTACGACTKACQTEVDSEFDFGLGKRKAIYRPNIFSFPMRYVLDKKSCSQEELDKIVKSCPYDAIDLNEEVNEFELNVSAITWATGWKPYDMENLTNLGGGKVPNVISNMQMERLAAPNGPTEGKILRPSDDKEPKRIAFVQCAGSRDENHLPYCSYICCLASLKHAMYVREKYPEAKVDIYYIDLRTPGRYENFLNKVQEDEKVRMIKGKVAEIKDDPVQNKPLVTVEDIFNGVKLEEHYDLVVLATGMQPSVSGEQLPMQLSQDDEGFIVGGQEKGVFPVGCAKNPLDVMTSAETATCAAMKAIQTMVGGNR